ncbi:MAG: hypothetical protein R3332_11605 [Pseudohongiellaceae bacterium]|nr:hypothetical protein [Pseudohongiellaceae bacterium]
MTRAYQFNSAVRAFIAGVEHTGQLPNLPLKTSEEQPVVRQQVKEFLLQSRYTSEMDFARRRR